MEKGKRMLFLYLYIYLVSSWGPNTPGCHPLSHVCLCSTGEVPPGGKGEDGGGGR